MQPTQITHLVHPSKHSMMRILIVTLITVITLSCSLFKPDVISPASTLVYEELVTSTQPPPITPTPTRPPALSFENFQRFSPGPSWDVPNIVRITGITLSPDVTKVALLTIRDNDQGWLELRESQSGNLLWEANLGTNATYNAVNFSLDGNLIATGTEDGSVRIWDTENGSLVKKLTGHKYPVRVVAFSPDGTKIASGGSDNTARVWQVSSGVQISEYEIRTNVRDIAFSPDSQFLAVTSNRIAVFKINSGGDTAIVYEDAKADTRDLGEVAYSSNGVFLIAAGPWYNYDNGKWPYRILIWDFPHNKSEPLKIPIYDAVEDIVVSPDSKVIVCVYKDKGKLLLIDIFDREIKGTVDIGPKLFMSYSPDISTFAVVSTRTTVTIWSVPQE